MENYRYKIGPYVFVSPAKLFRSEYVGKKSPKFEIRLKKMSKIRKIRVLYSADHSKVLIQAPFFMDADVIANFIRYHLLPTALAANGVWVLHASACAFQNHAFIFTGQSGVGKSTLAYLMSLRGFEFLSDESVIFFQNAAGDIKVATFDQPPRLRMDNKSIRFNKRDSKYKTYLNKNIIAKKKSKNAQFSRILEIGKIFFLKPTRDCLLRTQTLTADSVMRGVLENTFAFGTKPSVLEAELLFKAGQLVTQGKFVELKLPHRTQSARALIKKIKSMGKYQQH